MAIVVTWLLVIVVEITGPDVGADDAVRGTEEDLGNH